jgi:hypothetical protein
MAGLHDITIEEGATFQLLAYWKNSAGEAYDITDWSARMQVRRTAKSEEVVLSFTSDDGSIVVGTTDGLVTVTGLATLLTELPTKPCVYDLELESPDGFVKRLLEGSATISQEVTRD